MLLWTLLAAIGLACVHLIAGAMVTLEQMPRSRWLSLAGGASVAYVFVHLLPTLQKHQRHLGDLSTVSFLEHHVYLITLVGFAAFYGLETYVRQRRRSHQPISDDVPETRVHHQPRQPGSSAEVFWLHVGAFAAYYALIGYLLVRRQADSIGGLTLFASAMALHFLVNDYGLSDHHQHRYRRFGRWILAGAVLLGWTLGTIFDLGPTTVAVVFAFIGGALILNVIKEELPENRASRWWAFAVGAAGYAALLVFTE